MVFVFGIDIPLVELIFVLTLVLVVLFALMLYVMIKQHRLNKNLNSVLTKENLELKNLRDIVQEEKTEARLLSVIRNELDKLIYGEAYGKRLLAIVEASKKGKTTVTEKEKIQKLANAFWNEIIQISKKQMKTQAEAAKPKPKGDMKSQLMERLKELDAQQRRILEERKRIEQLLQKK